MDILQNKHNLNQNILLANQIWKPKKYDWHYASPEDTILLLHFNGNYTDSSIYHCTGPSGATPEYSGAPKFGSGCLYALNGEGTYNLSNSGWKFGDTDFTMDFWIKKVGSWSASYNSLGYIWGLTGNWGGYFESRCVANYDDGYGQLQFYGYDKYQQNTVDWNILTLPDDTNWHHLAYVWTKNDCYMRIFFDGKMSNNYGVCDFRYYDQSLLNQLMIGGHYEGWYIRSFGGCLDEFRITKKAVWTKDFIPPTQEYEFLSSNLTYTLVPADSSLYINNELVTTNPVVLSTDHYTYNVYSKDYLPISGSENIELGDNYTKTFTLDQTGPKLTIDVTPADANVTLSYDLFSTNSHYITAPENKVVNYNITKSGYTPISNTYTMTDQNHTLEFTMSESSYNVGNPTFLMKFDENWDYYSDGSITASLVNAPELTDDGPFYGGALAPTYDASSSSNRRFVQINITAAQQTAGSMFIEYWAKLQNNGSDNNIYQSFLGNMVHPDTKYSGWSFRWAQAASSYGALDLLVANNSSLSHSWTNLAPSQYLSVTQNFYKEHTASNQWAHYGIYFKKSSDNSASLIYIYNNGYRYFGMTGFYGTFAAGAQDNIYIGNAKYGTGYTLSPIGEVRILLGADADNYADLIEGSSISGVSAKSYTVPTDTFSTAGLTKYTAS